MGHLYNSAATATIPAKRARAKVARRHRRDDEAGVPRLPGVDEFELEAAIPRPGTYEPEPPWEPAPIVDDTFVLDEDEPDIDPDDIKWDSEFEGEMEEV